LLFGCLSLPPLSDASKEELQDEMRRLTKVLQECNIQVEESEETGGAGVYKTKIEDVD
jgi:hypothetical protein